MEAREIVHHLRLAQPDTCYRPSPDWTRVCILDLGHACPCGWESFNGERMTWARRIDGEACS